MENFESLAHVRCKRWDKGKGYLDKEGRPMDRRDKLAHAYPVVSAQLYILWFRSFTPIMVSYPVGLQARIVGTYNLRTTGNRPGTPGMPPSGGKLKLELAQT